MASLVFFLVSHFTSICVPISFPSLLSLSSLPSLFLSSPPPQQVIAADAHVRVSLVRARHEQRTAYLLLVQRVGNSGAAIRSAALHVPLPPSVMAQVRYHVLFCVLLVLRL
jgi:hypothetical protein